jgi:hypothetical protein
MFHHLIGLRVMIKTTEPHKTNFVGTLVSCIGTTLWLENITPVRGTRPFNDQGINFASRTFESIESVANPDDDPTGSPPRALG